MTLGLTSNPPRVIAWPNTIVQFCRLLIFQISIYPLYMSQEATQRRRTHISIYSNKLGVDSDKGNAPLRPQGLCVRHLVYDIIEKSLGAQFCDSIQIVTMQSSTDGTPSPLPCPSPLAPQTPCALIVITNSRTSRTARMSPPDPIAQLGSFAIKQHA